MSNIDYYFREMANIGGWCEPLTANIIYTLGSEQKSTGNLVEIGVHYGKSFIPLACTTKEGEVSIAIDIFDLQEYNYDKSGWGDRNIFLETIKHFVDMNSVRIIQQDSLKVKPEHLLLNDLKVRMFSIDGAHTPQATFSDLLLASSVLSEDGIVFLDDFLNTHWLGVLTGYVDFIKYYPISLIPIAMIPNKLVLCNLSYVSRYKQLLQSKFKDNLAKQDVPFMSHQIDIYQ